ncbi:helix-turn-helix domain-containing protein [Microbacterium sp. P06]|uniref:helix-turn-helix domain-containing protein n=1 Tax=Microbacterium sp. P06 TaxID=3366949 RepID=UPI003745D3C1
MPALGPRIAHALRREREAAGVSVSELARRAGVSKATVSQLEGGAGNPSVETLWALADALGVAFAVFVDEEASAPTLVRAAAASGVPSSAAPYLVSLLSASPPHARRDIYLLRAEPGEPRASEPHQRGTTEHVVLISGRARVGPTADAVVLEPGDYLAYAGDAAHVFEALEPRTSAVMVSELR